MLIKLKFFYDSPEGERLFDPSTIQFCNEYFAQSINAFKTFFSSTDIDINEFEIKVFCQNELNIVDDYNDAIRCMMNDVKAEDSCTFKALSSLFNQQDMVEKKVAMLRYVLENYFICNKLYNTRINSNDFVECYHDYWGPYNFKYTLPKNIISKYIRHYQEFGANGVDLAKLTPEELAQYVMPRYYHEIGAWDRESLRKDANKMEKLTLSWIE
jgi:hypothetical protein